MSGSHGEPPGTPGVYRDYTGVIGPHRDYSVIIMTNVQVYKILGG